MRKENKKILSIAVSSVLVITMVLASVKANIQTRADDGATESHILSNPSKDGSGNTVWDCIYFGNYYQNDTEGMVKEPIKWRILKIDGTDAFLIADKGLEVKPWNETQVGVTWENSTMRSWLNGYGSSTNICGRDYSADNFMDSAFTAEEQNAIKTTNVVNQHDPFQNSPSGNDTVDKVYLLSYTESMKTEYGFYEERSVSDTRKLEITPYVNSKLDWESHYSSPGWWLRSHGDDTYPDNWEYYGHYAAYIFASGFVYCNGSVVDDNFMTVRPVLHLDTQYNNLYTYAGTVSSDGSSTEVTTPPETTTGVPETTTEAPENIVISDKVNIEGFQIGQTSWGLRTISSVEPEINSQGVVEYGNIYAICCDGVTEQDMFIGSENSNVATYKATAQGIIDKNFSESDTAVNYVRTMINNGTTSSAYTQQYMIRAYAKLADGSIVYSNVAKYSIFNVAKILYDNNMMNTYSAHQYIYENILKVVDSSYPQVDYDWGNIIAKP